MRGVPASQIDPKLVEPLVDFILDSDDDALFQIGEVSETKLPVPHPHDFNSMICESCGEVVVESYARIKDGSVICIPCADK
jgi:formylmethanofuran dehydrogenase subunit E